MKTIAYLCGRILHERAQKGRTFHRPELWKLHGSPPQKLGQPLGVGDRERLMVVVESAARK
jgi:hypothetical protein